MPTERSVIHWRHHARSATSSPPPVWNKPSILLSWSDPTAHFRWDHTELEWVESLIYCRIIFGKIFTGPTISSVKHNFPSPTKTRQWLGICRTVPAQSSAEGVQPIVSAAIKHWWPSIRRLSLLSHYLEYLTRSSLTNAAVIKPTIHDRYVSVSIIRLTNKHIGRIEKRIHRAIIRVSNSVFVEELCITFKVV